MSSTMFHCDLCNTTMTGTEPYQTHIEGKKHLKKLKTVATKSVSEISTTSGQPDIEKGSTGNLVKPSSQDKNLPRHPEAVSVAEILGTTNADPVMNAVKANLMGKLPLKRMAFDGKCEICGVDYTSESHQEQHLSGKKHQKKVQAKQATEGVNAATLYCGFCNIHVNSVEQMDQHRSGTAHNKKVANAKNVQQEKQLEMKLPHSTAKKRFVPSTGTESWDSQIMPPPPLLPILKPLTYDK